VFALTIIRRYSQAKDKVVTTVHIVMLHFVLNLVFQVTLDLRAYTMEEVHASNCILYRSIPISFLLEAELFLVVDK